MKRFVRIAMTLGVFACVARAAMAAPADPETYIRDSEAAWVAAEVAGDPAVAQRVLADDYVGVFPDGSIGHKAEAVAYFKSANAIPSGRLDYVHVHIFGDTAIAQGQETDVRPAGGPLPSGRLIFTDVWLLRRGAWQIVNSEDQFQPTEKP